MWRWKHCVWMPWVTEKRLDNCTNRLLSNQLPVCACVCLCVFVYIGVHAWGKDYGDPEPSVYRQVNWSDGRKTHDVGELMKPKFSETVFNDFPPARYKNWFHKVPWWTTSMMASTVNRASLHWNCGPQRLPVVWCIWRRNDSSTEIWQLEISLSPPRLRYCNKQGVYVYYNAGFYVLARKQLNGRGTPFWNIQMQKTLHVWCLIIRISCSIYFRWRSVTLVCRELWVLTVTTIRHRRGDDGPSNGNQYNV